MGWTDNGKIMRPCIILSEQRETGRGGGGGVQEQRLSQVRGFFLNNFSVLHFSRWSHTEHSSF